VQEKRERNRDSVCLVRSVGVARGNGLLCGVNWQDRFSKKEKGEYEGAKGDCLDPAGSLKQRRRAGIGKNGTDIRLSGAKGGGKLIGGERNEQRVRTGWTDYAGCGNWWM